MMETVARRDFLSLASGQETPDSRMVRLVTGEVKTCKPPPLLTGTDRCDVIGVKLDGDENLFLKHEVIVRVVGVLTNRPAGLDL